jgi:protein gp37
VNRTKIDWAHLTWNPIVGCYGPGGTARKPAYCPYCYARRIAESATGPYKHLPKVDRFTPRVIADRLRQPLAERKPARIFVGSMGDLFSPGLSDQDIVSVMIAMAKAPYHRYMLLTKNPERAVRFFAAQELGTWAAETLAIGISAEAQGPLKRRVELLRQIPALVHYVSIEPMLGPITIDAELSDDIEWVIVGAQTGIEPKQPLASWIDRLRADTAKLKIPLFEKENISVIEDHHRDVPEILEPIKQLKAKAYPLIAKGNTAGIVPT